MTIDVGHQAATAAAQAAGVIRKRVSIAAGDAHLAGELFLPEGAGPFPAVTVTGTWTSVKEQMADRYAEALARRGIAALAFDFSGFGLSGGEPREVESAARKARDIRYAVDFLAGRAEVHADRIGAVAICASAMYAARAAIDDPRVTALALIAPWIHDPAMLADVYGGVDGVRAHLEAGVAARRDYERTGVVDYVPVADAHDPAAAMPMQIDFYTDPARGALPGWPNRFAVMAWPEWLTLDAIALAPAVRQPTLIVHSPQAAIPAGAQRFYDGLLEAKDLIWMDGAQFDFYDQPATVESAVIVAASWLDRYLGNDTQGA